MPRNIFTIKDFNRGVEMHADAGSVSPESAAISINIDADAPLGVLRPRQDDVLLNNVANHMMDPAWIRRETEDDLVYRDESTDTLKLVRDFHGAKTPSEITDYHTGAAVSAPTWIAPSAINKQLYIGRGHDLPPVWCGYLDFGQFGQSATPDTLVCTSANAKLPANLPAFDSMVFDKTSLLVGMVRDGYDLWTFDLVTEEINILTLSGRVSAIAHYDATHFLAYDRDNHTIRKIRYSDLVTVKTWVISNSNDFDDMVPAQLVVTDNYVWLALHRNTDLLTLGKLLFNIARTSIDAGGSGAVTDRTPIFTTSTTTVGAWAVVRRVMEMTVEQTVVSDVWSWQPDVAYGGTTWNAYPQRIMKTFQKSMVVVDSSLDEIGWIVGQGTYVDPATSSDKSRRWVKEYHSPPYGANPKIIVLFHWPVMIYNTGNPSDYSRWKPGSGTMMYHVRGADPASPDTGAIQPISVVFPGNSNVDLREIARGTADEVFFGIGKNIHMRAGLAVNATVGTLGNNLALRDDLRTHAFDDNVASITDWSGFKLYATTDNAEANVYELEDRDTELVRTRTVYEGGPISIAVSPLANPGDFQGLTTYFYRYTLTYNFVEESELSDYTQSISHDGAADTYGHSVAVSIRERANISPRATALNIYRARATGANQPRPDEEYRLVKSLSLIDSTLFSDFSAFPDTVEAVGQSYESRTGIAESIRNLEIYYGLSAVVNGELFIANCSQTYLPDAQFMVFKSKAMRFGMFNYTSDYLRLSFIPVAMVEHQGRLLVFSSDRLVVVNPEGMYIEAELLGYGTYGQRSVMSFPFGVLFASPQGIYLYGNGTIAELGFPVRTSGQEGLNYPKLGWTELDHQVQPAVFNFLQQGYIGVMAVTTLNSFLYGAMYMYHVTDKRWDIWNFPVVNQYPVLATPVSDTENQLYVGSPVGMYTIASSNNRKQALWFSQRLAIDSGQHAKKFYYVKASYEGSDPTIFFTTDHGLTWGQTDINQRVQESMRIGKEISVQLIIYPTTVMREMNVIYRPMVGVR